MLFLLTRLTPRISESKRLRASSHDFVLIKVKKSVEKANVHGHVHPPPPFCVCHVSKSHTGKKVDSDNLISGNFSDRP